MHRKQQFQDLLFRTILHAAMITLVMATVLVLVVVPAWAQNAVPPTAREAAAMPAFASRLLLPSRHQRRASIQPRLPTANMGSRPWIRGLTRRAHQRHHRCLDHQLRLRRQRYLCWPSARPRSPVSTSALGSSRATI